MAGKITPLLDPARITLEEVSDHTLVTIELGYGLVHLVDEKRGSPLVARITRRSADRLGLVTGMAVWAQIKAVAVIGYFAFGEPLGVQKLAALGLICGGVVLLATAA